MKTIKRFVVLAALILITIISLTSCGSSKGTGIYYYHGNFKDNPIEITETEWITTNKEKTYVSQIEWINDVYFSVNGELYYCDGSVMYRVGDTVNNWRSSKELKQD